MAKDFLGKEIAAGNYVCYPGRRSSSLWMGIGRIEGNTVDGQPVVRPIKEDYGTKKHYLARRSVLRNPSRAIVMDDNQIPEVLRALFQ